MTLAETILDKLRLSTNAPDTVDRLYRSLPGYDPVVIRDELESLAADGKVVWRRPTGDVFLPRRRDVGITD